MSNVTIQGKLDTDRKKVQEIYADSSGGIAYGQGAAERNPGTANQYSVGVDECDYHAWATATGDEIVESVPTLVFGVLVTVTTAGGAIEIRDGTTAGGTLVLTIPSGAAAGVFYELKGAKFNSGVFIDDASTSGSLTILKRAQ